MFGWVKVPTFRAVLEIRAPQLEALMSAATEKIGKLVELVNDTKTALVAATDRITADFEEVKRKLEEGTLTPDDLGGLDSSIETMTLIRDGLAAIDPDTNFPPLEVPTPEE